MTKNSFCETLYEEVKDHFYQSDNLQYYVAIENNGNGFERLNVRIIKDYAFIEKYRQFADLNIPEELRQIGDDVVYFPGLSLDVVHNVEQAELFLCKEYLAITAFIPKRSVTLEYSLMKKGYQIKEYTAKKKTYIVHNDGSIYTKKSNNSSSPGFYPTTVNDLYFLPKDLAEIVMRAFSGNSLLYKDFLRDNFFSPLPLFALKSLHNKFDYFQLQFPKVKFPASVNSMKCGELYAIGCAAKYIVPEQIPLLFQEAYRVKVTDKVFSKRNQKEIGKYYLHNVIKKRTKDESYKSFDYVDMALSFKEKIDITGRKKALIEKHDQLSMKILERSLKKRYGNKKIPLPETPLKYLSLPNEFLLLDTVKALCIEAIINHNCVAGYANNIISGRCVVYSANINGEHLTIEIRKRGKNKLYVRKCYTCFNAPCKEETLEYVKQTVEKATPNAMALFMKRRMK